MKDATATRFLKHFHLIAVIVWFCLVPPTLIWWKDSILWVALMSIWANIASHWSAWQAARTESKQDRENDS